MTEVSGSLLDYRFYVSVLYPLLITEQDNHCDSLRFLVVVLIDTEETAGWGGGGGAAALAGGGGGRGLSPEG